MSYDYLQLEQHGPVATLTLDRPDLHNAFNPALIGELVAVLHAIAADATVRVLVLTGAGPSFCAGGDIAWMRESMHYTHAENLADAHGLDEMFMALNTLSKPVIGRINGAAMGGGIGLVACCDLALAADNAVFGFSEVKLGLLPAVIAQYVVPKIGVSHSRALFVSGERFTAERAFEIGLVHAVVPAAELDATLQTVIKRVLTGGSQAMAASKQLVAAMWDLERSAAKDYAINAIAQARVSAEGQEGLTAFLEKRRPGW